MPTVALPAGRVTGTASAGVRAFRGLRYAVADRFGPPRPPPAGDQDGTRVGPAAPQNPDPLERVWGVSLAPGDEDCLRVNVWTPAGGTGLPVLVYVPGGAFIIGSGPWGWHDGADLAAALDCVVVSFNYRLGAVGFLDLSRFGREFADSGNLGLLDQLAALRWVREHIAAFGGDPGRVTLMGQSAGAISVACLLGSPLAGGLFGRAVCLSGGPTLVRTPGFAAAVTDRFLREAACDSADDLRRLPVAELLAAQKRLLRRSDFGGPQFGPTVGGTVLPDYPLDRVRAGSARGVPLLLGTTRDEMRLWKLYVPPLGTLPPEAVRGWVRRLVGDRAGALVRTYRAAMPGEANGNVLLALIGDVIFRLPVVRLAEAHGAARVVRLDHVPDVPGDLGAPHALDVALLFGNFAAPGIRRLVGSRPEAARDRLRELIGGFVRGDSPDLPVYDGRRLVTIVGGPGGVAEDPAGAERAAWDGVPFDGRHPALDNLPRKRELLLYLLKRFAVRLLPWAVGLAALGAGWAVYG